MRVFSDSREEAALGGSERRFLNCRVQQSSFKQDELEAAAEPRREVEMEEAEETERPEHRLH